MLFALETGVMDEMGLVLVICGIPELELKQTRWRWVWGMNGSLGWSPKNGEITHAKRNLHV